MSPETTLMIVLNDTTIKRQTDKSQNWYQNFTHPVPLEADFASVCEIQFCLSRFLKKLESA